MAERSGGTGVVLIVVGVAFLLTNLGIVDFHDLVRFWPLILIAVGVRMVLRGRNSGSGPELSPPPPP